MSPAPLCGIGLRSAHYRDFLAARPRVGVVEVHSENFFGRRGADPAGQPRRLLEQVCADYALSLHGVGLSLGSAEPVRREPLRQLKMLIDAFEPRFVSDHLAWVGIGGVYLNDLLPLPYTEAALRAVCANVGAAQDYLGRQLLIENPSRYLDFTQPTLSECEFLNALAAATGCGLLLDVNNVHVSAVNLGFDARAYLAQIDGRHVREIHLAGASWQDGLLIDTHSRPVAAAVWDLYRDAAARWPGAQALVEWDAELPPLAVLLDEARKADAVRAGAPEVDDVA